MAAGRIVAGQRRDLLPSGGASTFGTGSVALRGRGAAGEPGGPVQLARGDAFAYAAVFVALHSEALEQRLAGVERPGRYLRQNARDIRVTQVFGDGVAMQSIYRERAPSDPWHDGKCLFGAPQDPGPERPTQMMIAALAVTPALT